MKLFIPFIVLMMLLYACADEPNASGQANTEVTISRGRQLYDERCVVCHGSDGAAGSSGAANLQLSVLDTMALYHLIKDGRKNMPAYKGLLSDDEIKEVSKYISELKKQ